MQKSSSGQSALEYLMIVALSMMILIPATYFFFQYSRDSTSQIIDSQLHAIGRSLMDAAGRAYYSGKDSKISIEVQMPDSINRIYILDNRELVFNSSSSLGDTELVFFSDVNISSTSCIAQMCYLDSLSSVGLKKVQLYSNGQQIIIS